MFIGSCVILQPLRQGLRGSPFTDEDTDFREVKVLAGGHTAWDVKLGLSVCLSVCKTHWTVCTLPLLGPAGGIRMHSLARGSRPRPAGSSLLRPDRSEARAQGPTGPRRLSLNVGWAETQLTCTEHRQCARLFLERALCHNPLNRTGAPKCWALLLAPLYR